MHRVEFIYLLEDGKNKMQYQLATHVFHINFDNAKQKMS